MLRRQPRSTRTYTLLPNTMLFRSPIQTPLGVVHFLISHPTPPVFDGAENRNGLRNHAEIRLWAEYLSGAAIDRSEEHTSELQSLMRIPYTVFCLNKKIKHNYTLHTLDIAIDTVINGNMTTSK